MAVSVRLPPDTGPYIEHYLIQSNDGILSLESSRFKFDSIPALIAHYAQCCDELPVQLVLPRALREAKNGQQLTSLALLGQEFWRYPMSCPKPENTENEALLLDAKSPNSMTETTNTSGLGSTLFSGSSNSGSNAAAAKLFSPTTPAGVGGLFSQAGTPSDTTSSISSFAVSGGASGVHSQMQQLMSPESVDSIILTMSPVVEMGQTRNGPMGLSAGTEPSNALSTFKTAQNNANFKNITARNTNTEQQQGIRPQRPKPPNTLNLDLRKPPAPPMRWSKPLSPQTPLPADLNNASNNFTVTTTVTFSVDNKNSPQFVEVTTPSTANNVSNNAMSSSLHQHSSTNNATFQTFAKRLSPEGECKDTLSSQGSSSNGSRWHSQSSKDSNNSQRKILSPCTPSSNGMAKIRKSKRKESQHYQESDILESPQIYCRGNPMDKFSDYEDVWSNDPSDRAGLLSSFKPQVAAQQSPPQEGITNKRPDLLAETREYKFL